MEIKNKVDEINQKNLYNKKNSKVEVKIPSKEELFQLYKIQDLSALNKTLQKPALVNKMLAITCLAMLLEVFGQFFISVQVSFGYFIYNVDPKFVTLTIYLT